jgi:predicted dehydrogenase
MNTNPKIGVGIIGLSAQRGWAATAHVPALKSLSGFEIRALSTTREETAKESAAKFGISQAFSDYRDLVIRPEVDLVVVTVKVPYHFELVTSALNAGKMVYCEWPLGNGLKEAEEMAELARAKDIRTFVGLQARSAPEVRYIRDLIRSGYLGEVLSTSMVASGGGWGGLVRPDSFYLLDPSNGATLLTIPFGHAVDALCWCLGEFREVTGTHAIRRKYAKLVDTDKDYPNATDDQIAVSGILENGAVASVHYRGGMSRGTNFLWEINGTKGDIVVTGDSHLQFGNLKIRGANGSDTSLGDLSVPSSYVEVEGDPTDRSFNLAQVYSTLLKDIQNNKQVLPTFDDGVIRHRMLHGIEQAFATGNRQYLSNEK